MKIKVLIIIMCLFIVALFTTNISMAQSITASETTVEMYQGEEYDTELTVNANGYRVVERSYESSNPYVVTVMELNYYSLTNNIFKWILRFMGAAAMEVGIAIITATVIFEDEYGSGITIFASSRISVMVRGAFEPLQVSFALDNTMSSDAIKEDD